jgi:arginase
MMRKVIHIIGVPMDLGAGRRGVDMGPAACRVAGLGQQARELGYEVRDRGNVFVEQVERLRDPDAHAHYLEEIASAAEKLARITREVIENDGLPVVLGGDHSIAVGSVSGVASAYRERGEKIGIIWFDAHADMNTPESSPSGNIHGMPLACIMGHGPAELTGIGGYVGKVDPRNVAVIGVRQIDDGERALVRALGVRVFTARELDERGMNTVVNEALEIASDGTAGYHVTMDMDFVDPVHAPGVGTPVMGGATYRESHLGMEKVADHGGMVSLELTEVNPVFDTRNQTAELGVELLLSALGRRIL